MSSGGLRTPYNNTSVCNPWYAAAEGAAVLWAGAGAQESDLRSLGPCSTMY